MNDLINNIKTVLLGCGISKHFMSVDYEKGDIIARFTIHKSKFNIGIMYRLSDGIFFHTDTSQIRDRVFLT